MNEWKEKFGQGPEKNILSSEEVNRAVLDTFLADPTKWVDDLFQELASETFSLAPVIEIISNKLQDIINSVELVEDVQDIDENIATLLREGMTSAIGMEAFFHLLKDSKIKLESVERWLEGERGKLPLSEQLEFNSLLKTLRKIYAK